MAISGGIKFFNKSMCKFSDGASAMASTGNSSANYAIDRNTDTKWRSVGSDDTITETLEIDFNGSQTITRLLLLSHNFKQFTVKYDLSGTWTDFTGAVGLDGAMTLGKIAETVFADDSAYYEFNSVTTGKILISILKTQTANQEKFLTTAVATIELGTLQGYPIVTPTIDKNEKRKPALSGRMMIIKSIETFMCTLNFQNYPGKSPYNLDFDVMFSLFDIDDNFLIWLCGGRRGTYFSYQTRPFRLQDLYEVNVSEKIVPTYSNGIYSTSVNMIVTMNEAI